MSQPEELPLNGATRVEIVLSRRVRADMFAFELRATFPSGRVSLWVRRQPSVTLAHAWNSMAWYISQQATLAYEARIVATLHCLMHAMALAPDDAMIMNNFLVMLRWIAEFPMTVRQRMNRYHLGPDW
jgi:hypothetical protein